MKRIECDFCKGRKETLINPELNLFISCPKCVGVGSVLLNNDGQFFVIVDEIDHEKLDLEDDLLGRQGMRK